MATINLKQLPLFLLLLTLSGIFGFYLQSVWEMGRLPAYSLSTTIVVQFANLFHSLKDSLGEATATSKEGVEEAGAHKSGSKKVGCRG